MQFCSYLEKHGVYLLHSLRGLLHCTTVKTEVCGPHKQEISTLRADWLITVQSAEESDSPGTVGCTVDHLHPSTEQIHHSRKIHVASKRPQNEMGQESLDTCGSQEASK